jgi:hypothetical protein
MPDRPALREPRLRHEDTLMNVSGRMLLACTLLQAAGEAGAHHSYAMFDQASTRTLKGTVRTLEWTNPHVWVWVDTDDGRGGTTVWGFETNAPSELFRFFGWRKDGLTAGDTIIVEFAPLRSGANGGVLRKITLADGTELRTPRSTLPPTTRN